MEAQTLAVPGWRARLATLLAAPVVERALTILILINALTIGLQTYPAMLAEWEAGSGIRWSALLDHFDRAVVILFALELALRIVAQGRAFPKDGWNWFDTVVVGVSIVGEAPMFSAIRALRVLRVMRLMARFKTVRLLASVIWHSVAACFTISVIMLVVLFVFAIMGYELFGVTDPAHFGNVHTAMFSLFRVAALFAYEDVINPLLPHHPWAHFFLLPYFMIMSYVVFNFFSGMVIYLLYEVSFDELTGRSVPGADDAGEDGEAEAEPEDPGALAQILVELRQLREEVARLSSQREGQS
ncbi:ion transporter [Massilia sp. TS11]|uniref:ion transporter n=1 Tax=Massilia sp. TS11 TaxID=2908003 RepID=UPI001EDC8A10|nr:ion transporter [Massilia sp. TS11]MCG2586480.1 ion transporter [Massilia sp. TS11]